MEHALTATLEHRLVSPRRRPYLERLVGVFADNRERIDAAVASAMENWRMDRLSFIDRGILRLGATEIICIGGVPGRVAIQEAVRLAQRYGGDDSSRFVNGVLDAVYKSAGGDDASTASEATLFLVILFLVILPLGSAAGGDSAGTEGASFATRQVCSPRP